MDRMKSHVWRSSCKSAESHLMMKLEVEMVPLKESLPWYILTAGGRYEAIRPLTPKTLSSAAFMPIKIYALGIMVIER